MRIPKRTLVIAVSSVALVSMLAAAFVLVTNGARAATPYVSHIMTVHPTYDEVGTIPSTPPTVHFGCQLTVPAGCYGPGQMQAAYDVTPLLNQGFNGAGRTIVIIDAFQSPTIASDLATQDTLWGLPSPPAFNIIAPDGLTPFDPTNGDMVGWAGEITLDVEWSHAIAPGATIDLVLSKSDQDSDIFSAQQYVVNHNLGDVISQSFGEGESCMDPNLLVAGHAVFQQAANQNMTVFASSGDDGAAQGSQPPTCGGSAPAFLSASTPASDPLVTGVGGTSLDADGTTGAYHSEVAWNDAFGASGGGFSTVYSRPSYQAPFGVPNKSRGVPDVSYNAAVIPGVLTVWSSSGRGANLVFRFGGTSAGSPQWSALIAIADQMAGKRLGFLNNDLYHIGKKPKQQSDFHDVTSGNNSFAGITGYNAGPSWDAVTGLGSPDAALLLPDLINTHVG